ncbi:hypothetical protein [Dyella kyungheensis]|uniref:Uncharacterized protein n=1 Tax=Dyella kyungheensis TaxID=1242174 RepID=A0ABS2JX28_9GAMM|nr:hypothetical protein [Dyella kyungheensis]MBM7123577.1 hypothetical protein [Dyella kyungheensis]
MGVVTRGSTLLMLAAAALLPISAQASSAAPKLKCVTGPVAKQYGKTPWLVYGCEDGKSVLIVSAPANKAVRFSFTFIADEDGYALHGEGQGDKKVTDAAYQDLNAMSESDIAALVSETHKPSGS